MAFLRAISLFIFLLVNIIHAGPSHIGTHHSPPSKVRSEKYKITAELYSGNSKDPNWIIKTDDKSIDYIVRDIETYGQNIIGTRPVLSTDMGYKGFTLDHIVDGKSAHVWILPKCKFPKLEGSLVEHTAGTAIKNKTKDYIIKLVNSCEPKKAKTA